jgi:hypothetical protein
MHVLLSRGCGLFEMEMGEIAAATGDLSLKWNIHVRRMTQRGKMERLCT